MKVCWVGLGGGTDLARPVAVRVERGPDGGPDRWHGLGGCGTMAGMDAISDATLPSLPPHRRPVLYPDRYAWYVLASSLDVMVTVTLLVHLGGREVNSFAQWSIERFGTWGLIGLKFLSVILVVAICE